MIKQNEIVSYKKGDGFREVVLEDVLKILVGKGIIELVKLPTKKKIDKIAIGQTTDLAAYEIVQEIIKGDAKKLDVGPMQREVIKPLYLFLNKEVLLYAKLRKLRFKKGKEQKNKISKFVDELEIKHPEIKRAVVKAWLKMSD
jgi:tRNA(Ile)-lysidine synthase TilS/MesJ